VYRYYLLHADYNYDAAVQHTLFDVLKGFRSYDEALEHAQTFKGRTVCTFTSAGFPLHSRSLIAAVKIAKAYPQYAPAYFCPSEDQ
jgi:hypothetical protein